MVQFDATECDHLPFNDRGLGLREEAAPRSGHGGRGTREKLPSIKRDELLQALDAFDLEVADRRRRVELIDALARSRRAAIEVILAEFSRDRLKELCRAPLQQRQVRRRQVRSSRPTVDQAGAGQDGAGSPHPKGVTYQSPG